MGVRLNPHIDEVTAVPESIEYINKFSICGQVIPWDFIDEMSFKDYQLFIIMLNAYGNKMKSSSGGSSITDTDAVLVEGGMNFE